MKGIRIISALKLAGFLFLKLAHAQQMPDFRGQVFPANHALNMPVDNLPVHPNSANIIKSIGTDVAIHPDFGTVYDDEGTIRPMGIPFNVVGSNQPLVPIIWDLYADESDPGPWPVPENPFIETVFDWRDQTPGDRHMLIIDTIANILYETGNVYKDSEGNWHGGCGAVFDLSSNNLRPETWTSADAAGLPIFPLLIRYDEVERALASDGVIHHAIRFTVQKTRKEYIWPARHYASSSTNPDYPAMGLRFRLKADVDISEYSPRIQVILRTMKKYGLIVADNGSNWYFQGTHDDRWNDNEINTLKNIYGSDFEAVDISPWLKSPGFDPNSAAVPSYVGLPVFSSEKNLLNDCRLYQNYPNPFKDNTIICYELSKNDHVMVRIFDIFGKEVTVLVNEKQQAGQYSVKWDGMNALGQKMSEGLYLYQLQTFSGLNMIKRMLFIP